MKLASTGYRFARYYTGNARYRSKGPPLTPLRLLAPFVVISTVVVMASGVALLLAGPALARRAPAVHKVSFFVWVGFTAVHVLAHLPDTWHGLAADYGRNAGVAGRGRRRAQRSRAVACKRARAGDGDRAPVRARSSRPGCTRTSTTTIDTHDTALRCLVGTDVILSPAAKRRAGAPGR